MLSLPFSFAVCFILFLGSALTITFVQLPSSFLNNLFTCSLAGYLYFIKTRIINKTDFVLLICSLNCFVFGSGVEGNELHLVLV